MDTHTETYTERLSMRQSRMKIDSLLNPPTDTVDPYSQHDTLSSSSHASYPHFPDYSPTPSNGYWYASAASTAPDSPPNAAPSLRKSPSRMRRCSRSVGHFFSLINR